MFARLSFLIAAVTVCASCSTPPKNPDAFSNLDDLSAVAFFSSNMPIDFKFTKARQNKTASGDIQPWGLPHLLTVELETQLKAQGKKYLPLNVNPDKIKEGMTIARDLRDFYLGDRYQVLGNYLRDEAKAQGIKYLIVMHPVKLPEFPDHKGGFGLTCDATKNASGQLMGYALYRLDIWEVAAHRLVQRVHVTPDENNFLTGKTCAETRTISLDKLTSSYQQEFISLAKKSVANALGKLK